MSDKTFTNILKGVFRGSLVAFLTGLTFPLFFEGMNVITSISTKHHIAFTFLVYPGMYIAAFILVSVFYAFPCVIIGIALEFLFTKRILSRFIFALISLITTYLLSNYFSSGFTPDSSSVLPFLGLSLIIIVFHYLCFFVWRRSSDFSSDQKDERAG
jgi:hypothetical protein